MRYGGSEKKRQQGVSKRLSEAEVNQKQTAVVWRVLLPEKMQQSWRWI